MSETSQSTSGVLRVNDRVTISRHELDVQASRSGGPGGQHVNTSSTKIEVRWNIDRSEALSPDEKERVRAKLGTRVDSEGTLRVTSSESRSQLRNRELAESRLAELVARALVVPRKRRATKPGRAARESRLREKKEQGERKARRRWKGED